MGGANRDRARERGRATSLTISAHLSYLKGSGGKTENDTSDHFDFRL